jgi:hypothetical protein
MYNIALFVHVLGVFLLVGAVTTSLLTMLRVQTAGSVTQLRSLTAVTKWIEAVIVPAMVLIIVAGVYMVSQHGSHGNIPWTAGWVVTSFAVTVLLAIIGGTIEGRDAKRFHAAIASATGEKPNADLRMLQLASSPVYTIFFGASQVVAVLFLMTIRPSLAVSIAVCVVAAVASGIAGALRLRSVRRPALVE